MSTDSPSDTTNANSRSLLSRNSKITGDLEFPGQVEVLGRIDGKVKADSALIGEHGEVEGSIKAKTVVIKGTVNGDISGDSVTLHTGSRVKGEITYTQLIVEAGAKVDGQIHRAKG